MADPKGSIASRIRDAQTPAERLRRILGRLESYVPQIGRGDQVEAAQILTLLDQADALLSELEQQGADLGPEQSRFRTITQQLDGKNALFLKQLGGGANLSRMRQKEAPPRNHSWWFVDERLAAQHSARRRKALITGGIIVGVVGVFSVLYALFLAPDEATRERFRYEQNAEQALSQGDATTALAHAERALSYAPGDADLLVLKGASLALMGSDDAAERVFEDARARYDDPEAFYARRGQIYTIANRADLALDEADRMLELNPESALAYFQRGNAHATLGNYTQAISDMEMASQLAEAAGQAELQGMARVQLGNLMMMLSAPRLEEPTRAP